MSRERNRIIKPFEKNAVVKRNKNQSYTQYSRRSCQFLGEEE